MGDGQRALARRARARQETCELLAPIGPDSPYNIENVIQCGLGDWAEGPVLLSMFKDAKFLAVDPVYRYCHEAWRDGFRGPIIQGLLWSESGIDFELNDFRSRTSVFDTEDRFLGKFKTRSLTLDNAVEWSCFEFTNQFDFATLLWMDVEGAELKILEGARKTLDEVAAIVCELKDEPKFENWPKAGVMISEIEKLGFRLKHRVSDNGLFLRKF